VAQWLADEFELRAYDRYATGNFEPPHFTNRKLVQYATRGGSWLGNRADCLSFVRKHQPPDTRIETLGFRVVLNQP
jgi:formylglycine-generating enzyme required for sulfatase activity